MLWFFAAPAKAQEPTKNVEETTYKLKGEVGDIGIDGVSMIDDNGKVVFGKDTPLLIVDGKEIDGEFRINPKNVKSMSVLKDKDAEEKYGERGKNGVILITTKKTTTILKWMML
ncbi:MAG: hypothetical protein LBG19_09825 [Prevotellaceae bacterium]|jgi:TonB-dependent SusC/RagA subfamily outer membrane receptor|nr:hypothetical protein [Prevotellaceae bacterium]